MNTYVFFASVALAFEAVTLDVSGVLDVGGVLVEGYAVLERTSFDRMMMRD